MADKIKTIKAESGSDALAGLSSARCSNEDNYVFQKMMRAAIGTNNVDHCARLCHASTVAGLAITLGSGAMTNSIAEAADQDVVFVTGSNTTETHPVIGSLIRQAHRKGAKIIVAEPRRIPLCREADVFLQIKPGTNVALFNGMMNVIINEGLQDQKYIDERTEGYAELVEVVVFCGGDDLTCGIFAAGEALADDDKVRLQIIKSELEHSVIPHTGLNFVHHSGRVVLGAKRVRALEIRFLKTDSAVVHKDDLVAEAAGLVVTGVVLLHLSFEVSKVVDCNGNNLIKLACIRCYWHKRNTCCCHFFLSC